MQATGVDPKLETWIVLDAVAAEHSAVAVEVKADPVLIDGVVAVVARQPDADCIQDQDILVVAGPGLDLGDVGEDGRTLAMLVSVYGQTLFPLPGLHRSAGSPQMGRNLLPGIQKAIAIGRLVALLGFRRAHPAERCWGGLLASVYPEDTA